MSESAAESITAMNSGDAVAWDLGARVRVASGKYWVRGSLYAGAVGQGSVAIARRSNLTAPDPHGPVGWEFCYPNHGNKPPYAFAIFPFLFCADQIGV